MHIPFVASLSLLKSEILVLACFQPNVWVHRFDLQQMLRGSPATKDLAQTLHTLWRFNLLLERPTALLSEFMLSRQGMVLRHQIAQTHFGDRVVQPYPETPAEDP